MMTVLVGGPLTTVQDRGRTGQRALGIGSAGAMDRLALTVGNVLVGNSRDAAGIEIAASQFVVRFETDTWFALTGSDCGAQLDEAPMLRWWTIPARAGQVLSLRPPVGGMFAYLTVAGGIDTPPILGSRSTDLKGGFGGLGGRALRQNDVLPIGSPARKRCLDRIRGFGVRPPGAAELSPTMGGWFEGPAAVIRVLPAAEYNLFSANCVKAFWASVWTLQRDSNRVGYRLAGTPLQLASPLELFSHGILPGVVQVPPSGQPVVQMSDANTCGGYPKIGVVIATDLGRFAQVQPGAKIRFVETKHREALAAVKAEGEYLRALEQFVSLADMRSETKDSERPVHGRLRQY
jgi:5-oxoprolinase (ATP-hydrolysing) subunit C